MQYIRRVSEAEVKGPAGGEAAPGDLALVAPALVEFLTVSKWEDGSTRQAGTVMLMVDGMVWKAWIHDRDGKRSCFVSARDPLALLSVVEDVLANSGGEWRPDDRRVGKK